MSKKKKKQSVLIRLCSSASHYFKVIKKNVKTKTEKYEIRKFDPVVRKHVIFHEKKIK